MSKKKKTLGLNLKTDNFELPNIHQPLQIQLTNSKANVSNRGGGRGEWFQN